MKHVTVEHLNQGDLLTIQAASEMFGIAVKTLKQWAKNAKTAPQNYPKFAVVGKTTFMSKSDFAQFLNRKFNQRLTGT